jgi:hypothetical protein
MSTPSSGMSSPGGRVAGSAATSQTKCKQMLQIIRRECPGLVPPDPLDPGGLAPEVPVSRQAVRELFTAAALFAVGLLGDDGRPRGEAVVWVELDRELLVLVAKFKVRLGPGIVAVTIPVRCEEVGDAEVHVTFAVGSPDRPAGLLVATEARPRGPQIVVDLWGEALVAFAWKVLLDVAAHVAFAAGEDKDGQRLVPAALSADKEVITVLPQARHGFDRVVRP